MNARLEKIQPDYLAELVETEADGNNVMFELELEAVTAGCAAEGSVEGVTVVCAG